MRWVWVVGTAVGVVLGWAGEARAQDVCVAEAGADECAAFRAASRAPSAPGRVRLHGVHPLDASAARAAQNAAAPQPGARPGVEIDPRARDAQRLRRAEEGYLRREVATLDRIIANLRDGDIRRGDFVVRLGETCAEMARRHEDAARRMDEPIHRASARDRARLRARQQDHERWGAQWRERSIRAFASLLDGRPPRYRHMDAVLLALAYQLSSVGRADEARRTWGRLIREFPESPYLPHAYLAFGEHYFELGEMQPALRLYEHATRFAPERNPVYAWALYKQAWALYNLEDFAGSLERFVSLLQLATDRPDDPVARSLARQVRRELVLPYSRAGRVDRALAFFRRVAGGTPDADALAMFESLGEVYQDTGQWPQASFVWHRLMAEEPASERLCVWQARVVGGALATQPKQGQLTEVERLIDMSETFAERRDLPERVVRDCRERAATTAIALAVAWHREAIGTDDQPGTRDRRTMDLADRLYGHIESRLSLEGLPLAEMDARDRPTAARIAYYRAELLFSMERWAPCALQFDRAVQLDPRSDVAADAAFGAVTCWERRYQAGRLGRPDEERMVASLARYACVAPGGQDLDVALYRRARILLDHGDAERAAQLFARIAREHPQSAVAIPAANLWLEALQRVGQRRPERRDACWASIGAALDPLATRFCASPEASEANAELCGTLEPLRCDLIRADAESHVRGGRHRTAAERYLEIVERHPSCPRQDEVLWNAALAFDEARLIGRAIAARERLVAQHRQSRWRIPAAQRIGAGYHALAIYEPAAEWYERFANAAPNDERAADGLESAILFRIGLGQLDRAQAGARLYERSYARSRPRETARVLYSVGVAVGAEAARTRRGDPRAFWQSYLRTHGSHALPHEQIAAHVALARAARAAGDTREAETHVQIAIHAYGDGLADRVATAATTDEERARVLGATRDAVSEALFLDAESRYEAFAAIRLPEYRGDRSIAGVRRWTEREFVPWLERRTAALRDAEAAYARVAPLGVPRWEIAATSRIGQMYSSFIQVFRDAPIPTAIENDDELLGLYLDELNRQEARYERVAIERYETCLGTATRVRWFDRYSQQCENDLHALAPRRYPVDAELRGQTEWVLEVLARPEIPIVQTVAAR